MSQQQQRFWRRPHAEYPVTTVEPLPSPSLPPPEAVEPVPARPARLAITKVQPTVSAGDYPSKRVSGDVIELRAIVVCDGAMVLGASASVTSPSGATTVVPMERTTGYEFTCDVSLDALGIYEFTITAWIDRAATLQSKITRKQAAGQVTGNEEAELAALAAPRTDFVSSRTERIVVDRPLASFGAWYEFFPRSTGINGEHGTLRTAMERLDDVVAMGFDILYFPPIHPIGRSHRKGKDNNVVAGADDVGSPWAIGAAEGGHTAILPALGTFDDFDALVAAAQSKGLEIALDIAFQCAPDHPWVTEHPEWFRVRPDGTIAYAENPPKQYQDIVPFDFDSPHWRELWEALADVIRFWRGHGVRVFRIDNPHTKPFAFWEWLFAEMRAEDPGLVFLAEAFSHPDVMMQLSRIGFSVSYQHFPWQHSPYEIQRYYELLTDGDNIEHFRSSSWANTPDILTEELQQGTRQVFIARAILAATLSASYGIYGPVYELQVHEAVRERSEEYAGGEKYEVRSWNLDDPNSLRGLLTTINGTRRSHRALQHDRTLVFHSCDNERLVAYTKTPAPRSLAGAGETGAGEGLSDDPILVVCNTDYWNAQSSIVRLDLRVFGEEYAEFTGAYEVEDLLTGVVYQWHGADNWVQLDPWKHQPAHVFAVRLPDLTSNLTPNTNEES